MSRMATETEKKRLKPARTRKAARPTETEMNAAKYPERHLLCAAGSFIPRRLIPKLPASHRPLFA